MESGRDKAGVTQAEDRGSLTPVLCPLQPGRGWPASPPEVSPCLWEHVQGSASVPEGGGPFSTPRRRAELLPFCVTL